jgi:hypothetical protein
MLLAALLSAVLSLTTQSGQARSLPRPDAADSAPLPTALRGVTVVSVRDARLTSNQVVVIRDGVIEAIGSADSLSIPPDARVLELPGKYVTPGLIDFHAHLRSPTELASYLRYGVTTIVQLSGALNGAPDILDYRRELRAGRMIGPTLFSSGPILDGDPPINAGVSTAIRAPDDAVAAVRAQVDAGYDLIKVYNRLPEAALRPLIDEAHRLGKVVVGHIPRPGDRAIALRTALAAGLDVIAHGEEFFFTHFHAGVDSILDRGGIPWRDPRDVEQVTRWVLQAGTAIMPNLSFVAATRTQLDSIDALWRDPEFALLTPEVRAYWRDRHFGRVVADVDRFGRRESAKEAFLLQLTLAFSKAGVPLLLGTDASAVGLFPGASAHLELDQLVRAGLTPAAAIAAGTATPGELLFSRGIAPLRLGAVEAGARADLLVLDANPLADVRAMSRIHAVVSGGRWFSVDELDRLRVPNPGPRTKPGS